MHAAVTEGRARKERQLDIFEQRDHEFLERCRAIAVMVCKLRGEVSINDVRTLVEIPDGVHPSVLGAVFRTKQFQGIGYTEAAHPQAHARVVRVYQLIEKV
jgi:hypothetical protein